MQLVMATVYVSPRKATLYYEDGKSRAVYEYRWVNRSLCKAEVRLLTNFDPVKERWTTDEDLTQFEVVGWRACDRQWDTIQGLLLALQRDERNSTAACRHYQ